MTPSSKNCVDVVHEFWRLMATNDFQSVSAVLADNFILEWPQSNERIRGAKNFFLMNTEYPANGRWIFSINRVVGSQFEAVSDVDITDGVQNAHAVSFFTVIGGKISRIVEYWVEPYPAPDNRTHLVEPII